MIQWEELKDFHVFGYFEDHTFCIRINREKEVTALYYLGEEKYKWVPSNETEKKLDMMQLVAEFILMEKIKK